MAPSSSQTGQYVDAGPFQLQPLGINKWVKRWRITPERPVKSNPLLHVIDNRFDSLESTSEHVDGRFWRVLSHFQLNENWFNVEKLVSIPCSIFFIITRHHVNSCTNIFP